MPLMIDAKIKPAGDFAAVDAEDVSCADGRLFDYLPVYLTQEEYDALEEKNPLTPYMIVRDDQ